MDKTASALPIFYIIFAAAFVVVILVVVRVILKSIRGFSHNLFGTDSLSEGLRQQRQQMSETPRSLHAMTSVYLPQIMKDFPEFDYALYKNKAQSLLRSYFTAVSTKNGLALAEEYSLTLKNYVLGIIADLNSRGVSQVFNQAVFHDTQIARYIKNGITATIIFEISVGCYSYIVDRNGAVVFGDKNLKTQTVYEVGLTYVQDADRVTNQNEALGINCPNCGAPITSLGEKTCKYCGTAVKEINTRAWKFDSVREQTVQGRQY